MSHILTNIHIQESLSVITAIVQLIGIGIEELSLSDSDSMMIGIVYTSMMSVMIHLYMIQLMFTFTSTYF